MLKLNVFRRHIESILKDPSGKRGTFLTKFFLMMLSCVYEILVKSRYYMFRKKIFIQKKIPCKTISIGNLTVGGTGKTPFVIYLAKLIRSLGVSVVVASRGYSGKMESVGCVVSDGSSCFINAYDSGDEPYLIAKLLKQVPVIVGKNKFEIGMKAIDIFSPDVIIFDDAFQHINVKYDLNLVLLDSKSPLGNGFMLPRGTLREPVSALHRANAIISTRNSGNKPLCLNNSCPEFMCSHKLVLRTVVKSELNANVLSFTGRNIVAFSGIANNSVFYESLTKLGFFLKGNISFNDHHKYNFKDIKDIIALVKQTRVSFIATTDKDYVKLENKFLFSIPLLVFGVDINFSSFKSEINFINFISEFILT